MKTTFPLPARAEAAAACAAAYADDVDERARFPVEAIDSFRRFELLGALVPERLGGPGCTLAEVATACRVLGRACGSSALIYAMHQIQVACLLPDAEPSPEAGSEPAYEPWAAAFLRRVGTEQKLLASVTSEIGIGGNIRTSACAPIRNGDRIDLLKRSPAISYGAHADALLVTARRDADAPPSDQILVVAEKHQTVLTETARWNTLGMRGTDSRAFDVAVAVDPEQVLPTPFADLAQHTMLPVSHILWGSAWLGIAADAVEKAREFLRRQIRSKPDALPPGAVRLQRAVSVLQTMEARLDRALEDYRRALAPTTEAAASSAVAALPLGFLAEVNGLKVTLSELALDAVGQAMLVCGLSGYQCGTPFSLGRHLRDLHSAPLMVNNDRISANVATQLVAQRAPLVRS